MKNTNPKATKTVYPIICQIVNTIPTQFIVEAAKAHNVLSRTFSPKSHVAAMLYCQVSKTESLNSICDVAYANESLWRSMGVTPPLRNTLSNANAKRPSDMAKDLYWRMFNYLTGIAPKFGTGKVTDNLRNCFIRETLDRNSSFSEESICPKPGSLPAGTISRRILISSASSLKSGLLPNIPLD